MSSRETELYKDKIEVSLDGRQIFYLFFGGAMIIGVVFVLGVLVGRRVEARGHVDRARTHAATDPLAALNRLEGDGGLSFRGTLTGKDAPSEVEGKVDAIARARGGARPDDAKPDGKGADVKVDKKVDAVTKKPEVAKVEPAKPEKKLEVAKVEPAKPEKKLEVAKVEPAKVEPAKPEKKLEVAKVEPAKPEKKPEVAKVEPAKAEDAPKTRYTLQLSAFQDRAEAEAFLASIKSQGYRAQITQAEVEGKGTFFRVRMGNYKSLEAATNAKSEFEELANKSASIMKL